MDILITESISETVREIGKFKDFINQSIEMERTMENLGVVGIWFPEVKYHNKVSQYKVSVHLASKQASVFINDLSRRMYGFNGDGRHE